MDSDSDYDPDYDMSNDEEDDQDGGSVSGGSVSGGSDYSSTSTDIILADAISFSDDSTVDMSDLEDTAQNNGENGGPHHPYMLRTRSRNGGNVAPIPPSRISNVNSDTEMESVNGDNNGSSDEDDGNQRNSDVEEVQESFHDSDEDSEDDVEIIEDERANEVFVIDDDNDELTNDLPSPPVSEDSESNEFPSAAANNENNMDESGSQEFSTTNNIGVNSQRQPLSEIATSQQTPGQQETPTKSKENDCSPKAKKNRLSTPDDEDVEDGMTCSVCLDVFTNSGPHRLVSLRCGHLFGHSCVERWLKSGCMGGARRCPTCNKKANLKDIRVIYARKLQALDTSEKDRILVELERVKEEKSRLEIDLTKVKLNCDMQKKVIESLQEKIIYLESKYKLTSGEVESLSQKSNNTAFNACSLSLVSTVDLKYGGCRVLEYSQGIGLLVASQKSGVNLFPGFGIRKIDSLDLRPTTFVNLHSGMIRDLAFHSQDANLLLSVSLDRTTKIFDNVSNSIVQTFRGDNLLWSCAWDVNNPHRFITGSQNGIVTMYDKRQTSEPVSTLVTNGDTTPVVSLASIPPTRNSFLAQGGFLSCRLNAVYGYCGSSTTSQLVMLDGPFISLNYNPGTQLVLVSTRPSSRHYNTRHILNQLAGPNEQNFCNKIHTFMGGNSGKVMSRSCQLLMRDDDVWIAAHNESKQAVELLSMNKDGVVHTIPTTEAIYDLRPLKMNNSCFLGSLSGNNLLVHKVY